MALMQVVPHGSPFVEDTGGCWAVSELSAVVLVTLPSTCWLVARVTVFTKILPIRAILPRESARVTPTLLSLSGALSPNLYMGSSRGCDLQYSEPWYCGIFYTLSLMGSP